MAIIHSDNPGIEKHLNKLEALVEDSGGGLHSQLVIKSEGGNLAVETVEPMDKGREIIRLTRQSLLPEDQYKIGVQGDHFTLDFPSDSLLSDLQKKLTDCMVNLYNETGKVRLHRSYSFLLSLRDYPEILKHLQAGRVFSQIVTQWAPKVLEGLEGDEEDRFLAETFLKTRHLGYNDHVRVSNVSILMPVVDFLNHHWRGAGFNVVRGVRKGDLTVNSSHPLEGCLECYAFYGALDAFDSWVRYDFIDLSAPIVRSVPLELVVPGVGTICVGAPTGGMSRAKLAKAVADLRLFVPTINVHDGDNSEKRVDVSFLMIPVSASPKALVRVLHYVLALVLGHGGDMTKQQKQDWVKEAEHTIVEKNIEYYKTLLTLSEAHISDDRGASDGAALATQLAHSQLEKLGQYSFSS